ncbi:MAG TPA: TRAP transporter large permease subunit [Thermohalobaculum sp.]|nr:TRAP transporter large permease subunit [Thermohalobaculum sp.]
MELYFLLLLIVLMVLALGSGYPVAFALPGSAILAVGCAALAGWLFEGDNSAYFSEGGPVQWLSAGVTNFRGIYWEAERDTLIAIPLFIFMGIMLQRSRIAEDLLVTMAQLFGPIPGGLGISVVFVGALLAATTGIVGATVVAMGLISLPAMLRHNYSKPLATGTIAASGTLGQIIPPSIVLIILADQLSASVDQASTQRKTMYRDSTGEVSIPSEFDVSSTSAGEMFMGAMIPGLVLVGIYMAFILGFALLRPSHAPPVPFEGRMDRRFAVRVALILVPPLALIIMVLGSIIAGIATVNQAGAIGAAGALIMAGYRLVPGRRDTFLPVALAVASLALIFLVTALFNTNIRTINTTADMLGVGLAALGVTGLSAALAWSAWRAYRTDDTLTGVMIETAKTTALVFVILMGAAMLTSAFRGFGGEEFVREFLEQMPGGFWSKFITVMAVIFLLGFFLDFIEIAVVVVPIVAPILLADPSANISAVWLGVMIGLNIQTSFLTPPFGFALFYLRGVAPPEVSTVHIYRGVIAFIALQLVALGIVGWNPPLVNYLPNRISLTGETAPPPVNPRLQYCIEEYVWDEFQERGSRIRAAIEAARALDLSPLPEALREDLHESFEHAASAFELLEAAKRAEANVEDHAPAYRPLHREVRQVESDIRQLEDEIAELSTRIRRARGNVDSLLRAEAERAEHEAEIEALRAEIPPDWEAAHETFLEHTRAERTARRNYRRAVDQAYPPAAEALAVLEATEAIEALHARLTEFQAEFLQMDRATLPERIRQLESEARGLPGEDDIATALDQVEQAVRPPVNMREAYQRLTQAMTVAAEELEWRRQAEETIKPGLVAYEAAIRDTIGLRSQRRLPEKQALYVASCSAVHRDISLNF